MSKTNLFGLLALGAMGLVTGYAGYKVKEHQESEDYAWREFNKLQWKLDSTKKELDEVQEKYSNAVELAGAWYELYNGVVEEYEKK